MTSSSRSHGAAVADVGDVTKGLDAANGAGRKRVLMLVRSGERQRFVALPVAKPKS